MRVRVQVMVGGKHTGKITIHDYDFFTINRQERKVRKEVKIMPNCNATGHANLIG
jgi:hypothetical protein